MAMLEINGKRIEVDDSFLSLPPEQQNATVEEIATSLGAAPQAQAPAPEKPLPQNGNFLDPLVGQGLLMGYGDELKAAVRGGIDALQGEGSYDDMYDKRLKMVRGDLDAFTQRNPVAAPVLEASGAVAGALVAPQAQVFRGATMAGRAGNAALTGAGFGAVVGSGKGETTEERISGGASGAALGGALGAVATPVVEGVVHGVNAAARPVGNMIRGVRDPDAEAARRIGEAFRRDNVDPARAAGVLDSANQHNIPLVAGDMAGDTTRALARSSANTSTEARGALQRATNDRFESQADRADTLVRSITGADGDTQATEEGLRRAAQAFNRPRYNQAYQDGAQVWTPELEQLIQAPAMQEAIRRTTRTSGNRAAAQGGQPVTNPFEVVNGRVTLRVVPGNQGPQHYPSLAFWDNVKRNLDDVVSAGQRAGRGNYAGDVRELRNMLRDHLDTQVPSYRAARQGAAGFFGAEDALEAGRAFFNSTAENAASRRAVAAMNPAERRLFARGYANSLLDQIGKVGDRRDIANALMSNPKAREKAEIALGRQAAERLEAFVRLENIMSVTRQQVQGNSTTARQLVEMGLAGGAGGAMTGDWQGMGAGALLAWGARRGGAKINDRLARRVGEMLASNDPNVLRNAAQLISRTPNLMNALRVADNTIAKSLGTTTGDLPVQYGAMQSAAEEDRRQPVRMGQ